MRRLLTNQEIADLVRWLRKRRGLTIREVSEQTGVDSARISRLECGRVQTGLDTNNLIRLMNWCAIDQAAIDDADGDAMPAIKKLLAKDRSLTPYAREQIYQIVSTTYEAITAQ